jgi:hypothetical protein
MQTRSASQTQRQELTQIQRSIQAVTERLGQTAQLLADGLKPAPRNMRMQR